jgi:hypothetical protein
MFENDSQVINVEEQQDRSGGGRPRVLMDRAIKGEFFFSLRSSTDGTGMVRILHNMNTSGDWEEKGEAEIVW